MPLPRGKKATGTAGSRLPKLGAKTTENQEEGPQVKRSTSPPRGAPKKRTAFIDITNAHVSIPGGKKKEGTKKQGKKASATSVSGKNQANLEKSSSVTSEESLSEKEKSDVQEEHVVKKQQEEEEDEEVWSDAADSVEELAAAAAPSAACEVPAHLQKPLIPEGFDIDSPNTEDCFMCPEYAKEIFDYLKEREEKFVMCDYMPKQPSLNPEMRTILIDWLVEVQENFELYHETLYLAVKMTDHYLAHTPVHREMLQLVGSTTMLIACKFEERSPPSIDDFLYICDDAYKREELLSMEANILQALSFDINIPIPYRFLRRYAKCVNASMETLTLARYFCEMSLMDMDFVPERGSLLASACLLMALVTKDLGGWTPILQFHSGYQMKDLAPLVWRLHAMMSVPPDSKLNAIRNKYAHKVFFEVASLPLVDIDILEAALSQ